MKQAKIYARTKTKLVKIINLKKNLKIASTVTPLNTTREKFWL